MSCRGIPNSVALRMEVAKLHGPRGPSTLMDETLRWVLGDYKLEDLDRGPAPTPGAADVEKRNAIANTHVGTLSQLPPDAQTRLIAGGYDMLGKVAQLEGIEQLRSIVTSDYVPDVVRALSQSGLRLGLCPDSLRDWIRFGVV